MRHSTLLCAPLLVLALLAGCDQGESLDDTPRADADSSTAPADDGSDATERGTGGASCLVGSWELVNMSEYGVDSIESLGGAFDFALTFDDGTASLDITWTVPETDYTEAVDFAVAFEGDYSVSDGTIKVSDLTGSTTINSEERSDDPDFGFGFGSMNEGETDFSCSGDTLTLDGEKYSRK
ncbi:MAG: hypothetical protein FWH11_11245 [Micrococcales bacterium]|nr:hypothetical protein [Micrococcales bacterium]